MQYLVTGGAGFIGSHIVDQLVSDGHKVKILDNLTSGHLKNLSKVIQSVEFIEGDIRDPEQCLRAAHDCDGIFHEAALVSVFDSIERPKDNHEINISGTLNVLEAARTAKVDRIVFASSAAIYGDEPTLPKTETMPAAPLSPYGTAKICAEYYLANYAEHFGLDCVALRYFNVYGPRQDPSSMYSGVVSKFIDCVNKKENPQIFGDGYQTRDFVYIDDVVQANVKAMYSRDIKGFKACNVGTGIETSLLMLISALNESAGTNLAAIFHPARVGDIRHSLADIKCAETTLEYSPKATNISRNLLSMLEF